MPQVTMSELNAAIDLPSMEEAARAQWEKERKRKRSVAKWIIGGLPLALLVMALVFYALSAPHTAAIGESITPGWGWAAPVGIELGIVTVSALMLAGWQDKKERRRGRFMPSFMGLILYGLLMPMSIIINIAGGFIAVVSHSGLETAQGGTVDMSQDTLDTLISRFGTLPATTQVVLILVPFVGVLIPIMAKFAGEALMKFSLDRIKLTVTSEEDVWAVERAAALQRALYDAALKYGATPARAGNWAASATQHYYRDDYKLAGGSAAPMTELPARRLADLSANANGQTGLSGLNGLQVQNLDAESSVQSVLSEVTGQPDNRTTGQTRTRNAGARVMAYLQENPDAVHMPVRDLTALLNARGIPVKKTTVGDVQKKFRAEYEQ